MVKIYDNKIDKINEIYEEVISLPYFYGEKDNPDDIPSGMVSEINEKSLCYLELCSFCEKENIFQNFKITRFHANIFAPREYCKYHIDRSEQGYKTLLYYPNTFFDINEGGETKFISDNNTIVSILPVPGRIVLFDSNILHTACSFKTYHRFSVAMKLEPK